MRVSLPPDATIGGLLSLLRAADLYDDALIVVTSDHGESFLDHDIWVGHGLFLTDDEIRVPLVVKLPGNRYAGTRVREMVRQLDVAPSMFDALGVPSASSFQGQSLLSPNPGLPESLPQVAFGSSNNIGASFLRTNTVKFITAAAKKPENVLSKTLKVSDGSPPKIASLMVEQLYDIRRDPSEQASIADQEKGHNLELLRSLLMDHTAECLARREELPQGEMPELSKQAQDQLRALGYVD